MLTVAVPALAGIFDSMSVEPQSPGAEPSTCPPPLAWQDVLGAFLREAEPWYLERDGYRVTGRIWGRGSPLYFLPGFSGTLDLFALLVWLLRDDWRCVLLDYPGNLDGRLPPGAPRAEPLAADLLAVADLCGDREFDVFGTSFGTLVAVQAMLDHPQRIRRAVLQAPFARRQLSLSERLLTGLLRRSPGRLQHLPLRTAIQTQNHRRWFPPFDATRFEFFRENSGGIRLKALAWRAAVVQRTDLQPRLCELTQPLLVLQGEGEGAVAEACLQDFARVARSDWKIERLNNTGQLPYLTHPHRVAKLIREHLGEQPPG